MTFSTADSHSHAHTLPANGLTIVPPAPGEPLVGGGNELQTSPKSIQPTPTPTTRAFTLAAGNPTTYAESQASFLSPDRVRDSDSVSIASTASGRKRRLWRRSSTASSSPTPQPQQQAQAQASSKRKTTGLASALVASVSSGGGGGTPNSPPRHSASPPISPPRRMGSAVKRSPALSGHRAAASQSSIDSSGLQLSPQGIRSRQDSLSVRHLEHESGYVSSDGRDDDPMDDDDSEDDELLAELNDGDIPVTGFAVASNKRNADFHELFKTIPEGDYLIEGASACLCCVERFASRLDDLDRLWLCPATGDPRSRSHIHFGEPHLLPREHLWMDHRRA
jgi:hypothetical protein